MRFTGKLLALLMVGIGMQLLIERHEADIDEAQFAARCLMARLRGGCSTDLEMMAAADALKARHWKRVERKLAAADRRRAATRPAGERGASAADELEWSLREATSADHDEAPF